MDTRRYGPAVDTETVVYRVANRRGFLIWSAICAAFAVGFAVSIPLAPPVAGGLLLPGLLGLFMCPLLLNFAFGKTIITREGVRTQSLFGSRSCRWDEVAAVHSERHSVRANTITVLMVELADGRRFKLKAPANRTGDDPRTWEALAVLQDYRARSTARP